MNNKLRLIVFRCLFQTNRRGVLNTFLLLVVLLTGISELKSQKKNGVPKIDFEHYRGLICDGNLPVDFSISSVEKIDKALAEYESKDLGKKEAALEEEHIIRSVFAVDELLMSGRILFGDPMSTFVEEVGQKLLAANDRTDLMESLRFYVLKSNEVNAYATSNGVVIVTVGLLSRIENESQLAFILAHEIQHYIQKHSLQQFKRQKSKKKGGMGGRYNDESLKDVYQFSKENEMEADEKGFEMMVRSGYDLVEGVFVFDMLKYGEYPFLEAKLSLDSFESGEYKFPKTLKDAVEMEVKTLEITDGTHLEDMGNDDNSTHPSLDRRIVRLRDMIDGVTKSKRAFFLVGEERFRLMQKLARHELLLVYIQRADFGQMLYLTHVMRVLYGESLFFDQVEAMGLYGTLLHKVKEHDMDRYGYNVNRSRGEWRPYISGIRQLDAKALGAFGAKRFWEMWQRGSSGDDFFGRLCKNYFVLLQKDVNFRLQDFLDYLPPSEMAKADSAQVNSETGDGKLKNPRSRAARSRAANVVSGDYYMSIFYSSQPKEPLQNFVNQMKFITTIPSTAKNSETTKKSKKKGFPAVSDMTKLVLFEPNVEIVRGNNVSSTRDPFGEFQKRNDVIYSWTDMGDKLDVDIQVLPGSTGVEKLTTEKLNQFMKVNDWMMERMNNDTQAMVLFGSQFVADGMGGSDNKYLAWVAYESTVLRRKFEPSTMAISILLYPIFPYYLFYQLSSTRKWEEFLLVYNVNTGSVVHVRESEIEHNWQTDFVKSRIYNQLYHIKNGGN